MKTVTIPAETPREKDPGYIDANDMTWPDPETVRQARAAIKRGDHLRRLGEGEADEA